MRSRSLAVELEYLNSVSPCDSHVIGMNLCSTKWPAPQRIFLATYDRADHAVTTLSLGVVGLKVDGKGTASKANQLEIGDWVLTRVSEFGPEYQELVVVRPGRVVGR